jgi:hypothetical protein
VFEKLRLPRTIAPLAAAAVTALGVGGVAIAQSSNPATPPAVTAPQSAVPDAETTGPETSATDTDNIQHNNGKDDATEQASGSESPEKGESSSEAPGSDGPGGHADEPGNPNADHQATGTE